MDNEQSGGHRGRPVEHPASHDAAAIAATAAFRELVRSRARFTVPVAALSFGAYLLIIVLSGFTPLLNAKAVGALSWTAVLTALVFPMVWLLCGMYGRRAGTWDALAEKAIAEAGSKRARP